MTNTHPKIAVIYTGEPRTVSTVIDYFIKNVLTNENVHVFSVLQTENHEEMEKFLFEKMGNHLKSLTWFSKQDFAWNLLQRSILRTMEIEERWKYYLKNGGSMVEYYQLYLAQNQLTNYENHEGIKYDYILRIRPDTIITRPINFNFLNMDTNVILKKLNIIAEKTGDKLLFSKKNITVFMNSLLDERRMSCENIDHSYENDRYLCYLLEKNLDDFSWLNQNNSHSNTILANRVQNFIKNGNYVLTFRANVIYFMNRKYFNAISQLGLKYGSCNLTKEDYYWWNAECQFQSFCIQNDMHIFNTTRELEGRSICSYEPEQYYNKDGELIDGNVFFFIKRS
uniref:Uncharacterized protein n=1 Tax=viral metagenome TaxID=1070528 RepID=A0A6C0F6A6_9ZZZZ